MARLIIRNGSKGLPEAFDLRPGRSLFGRSAGNDFTLQDPAVSESHCELDVSDGFVIVRDLGSTNGTYVDHQRIGETTIYPGQTLQIGALEMILEADAVQVALPKLHVESNPYANDVGYLDDGYAACREHSGRHAVWECTHCGRVYCDECVKKLRRIGGAQLRLCPNCGQSCKLSAWSESVKRRKKSFLNTITETVFMSFKRTTQLFTQAVSGGSKKRQRKD